MISSNPKAGELSKKLVAENSQGRTPAPEREQERLVVSQDQIYSALRNIALMMKYVDSAVGLDACNPSRGFSIISYS